MKIGICSFMKSPALVVVSLLAFSNAIQPAQAQVCGNGIAGQLTISDLAGNEKSASTPVRVGDVLKIKSVIAVNLSSLAGGSYEVTNLSLIARFPDTTRH